MKNKIYILAFVALSVTLVSGCITPDSDPDHGWTDCKLNIYLVNSEGCNVLNKLQDDAECLSSLIAIADIDQIIVDAGKAYSGELPSGMHGGENPEGLNICGDVSEDPYWDYCIDFFGLRKKMKSLPDKLETRIKSREVFGDNEWHVLRTEWKWEGFKVWAINYMNCTAAYFDDKPLVVSKYKYMSHEPQTLTILVD